MQIKRALHSYSYRIALMYLFFFLISSFILFAFFYLTNTRIVTEQLDHTLEADKTVFIDRYTQSGLNGLIRLVNTRAQNLGKDAAYSLITSEKQIVAGNLGRWPNIIAPSSQTSPLVEFQLGMEPSGTFPYTFRGQVLNLTDGYQLLISRSKQRINHVQRKLVRTFAWASLITLLLGLVGGYFLSKRAVRRITSINQLCRSIIEGDISQRLSVHQAQDDLDDLSININSMLDKIETLMQEIVQVSDNIAHDLRTPLSHLRFKLEALQSQENLDQLTQERLRESVDTTDDLIDTFNSLLRISKIEARNSKNQFSLIALSAILEDVAELYRPIAEEKNQTLELCLSKVPNIKGDKNLLFQALSNLLDNAIKYGADQSNIYISLEQENRLLNVCICDNGPGVPEQELSHLSTRFYRVDAARSQQGNGLGLSLVKAICGLHQAKLELTNRDTGGFRACLQFSVPD